MWEHNKVKKLYAYCFGKRYRALMSFVWGSRRDSTYILSCNNHLTMYVWLYDPILTNEVSIVLSLPRVVIGFIYVIFEIKGVRDVNYKGTEQTVIFFIYHVVWYVVWKVLLNQSEVFWWIETKIKKSFDMI